MDCLLMVKYDDYGNREKSRAGPYASLHTPEPSLDWEISGYLYGTDYVSGQRFPPDRVPVPDQEI
jgi:hypothetical protein